MTVLLKDIPNGTRLSELGKGKHSQGRVLLPTDTLRIRASYLTEDITKAKSFAGMKAVLKKRTFPDAILRLTLDALKGDSAYLMFTQTIGYQKRDELLAMDAPDPSEQYDDIFLSPPKPQEPEVEEIKEPEIELEPLEVRVARLLKGTATMHADQLGGYLTRNGIERDEIRSMIAHCQKNDPERIPAFRGALGNNIFEAICAEID